MTALETHLEKLVDYGFHLFFTSVLLNFWMLIKDWKIQNKKFPKEKVVLEDRFITIVTGSLYLLVPKTRVISLKKISEKVLTSKFLHTHYSLVKLCVCVHIYVSINKTMCVYIYICIQIHAYI